MANYQTLISAIQQVVKTNGNNEITGALLQQSLLAMIDSLGSGYQFMGIATTSTNPGTPDQNVFYIASVSGTYPNFGGIVVNDGEFAILAYNGSWSKLVTGAATNQQVSDLRKLIYNNYFVGNGNSAVTINIEGLLPNHKYRLWAINPDWNMDGVTVTGVARLSAYYNVNGARTNIAYVDVAGTVASYYDFTTPAAIDDNRIYIGGRAKVGEKARFVISEIVLSMAEIDSTLSAQYDLGGIYKEYFDQLDILENGTISNLSSDSAMFYADSTTRVRTKAAIKIRVRQGDIIESAVNDLKLYAGIFKLDGTYMPYGWAKTIIMPADADVVLVIKYNEDVGTIDLNYAKSNIYILSKRASLMDSFLRKVDYNNIDGFVGFNINKTTKIQFPNFVIGKPLPIIMSYFAEITGSGEPYITFEIGPYVSTRYIIKNGSFKQIRIPPVLFNMTAKMTLTIPTGTTVLFRSMSFTNEQFTSWEDCGIRLNSHLGFLRYAPEQTKISFEMSALMGYKSCIVNPIKTSDGVWMCYHENKQYLSPDGTLENRIALTGAQFNAKTFAEIRQYGVIPYGMMKSSWGAPPVPTLNEFFDICAKTSMRPIFSVHPDLSTQDWQEIKTKLLGRNLLHKLTVKVFNENELNIAFNVLGNDIDEYVYITYLTTSTEATTLINTLSGAQYDRITTKFGVELAENASYTQEIIGMFVAAGFPVTAGTFNPTDTNVYETLISYGVSEFTDDLNPNAGINW